MTQANLPDLVDDDDGEVLFNYWNGFAPAYRTGQAGTSPPAWAGKGFPYPKLDGAGELLGLYLTNGDGTDRPVSPAHILWGVTDAEEARSALGFEAAIAPYIVGSGGPPVDRTAERGSGVYQNTWLRPRIVMVYDGVRSAATTGGEFLMGVTAGEMTWWGLYADDNAGSTPYRRFVPQGPFIVPPGWFYQFTGPFDVWKEA